MSAVEKGQKPPILPLCWRCNKNAVLSWRNLFCEECLNGTAKEMEEWLKNIPNDIGKSLDEESAKRKKAHKHAPKKGENG